MPLLATLILAMAIAWRMAFPDQPRTTTPILPIDPASKAAVTQLENRLQRNHQDPNTYAQLGLSLLQQVRETGDSTLYVRAEQVFAQALEQDPNHLDVLIGKGILATALHDFEEAIKWAKAAQVINPWRAETLGILIDSYVELGRYEDAVQVTQQMVDLRPGLESYSRVSYIREIYGDMEGAIQAMQAAVEAGVPGTEAVLWSQIQLANLYINLGDLEQAEGIYQSTLAARPDYLYGKAGMARVQARQGNYREAAALLEVIVTQQPLPEFVIMLGTVYERMGQLTLAQRQRDLVHVMQMLNVDAGMNVDLELAAFEVEYGDDPAEALQLAMAAYEDRPTVFAADILAWAHYKNGNIEEATMYSQEAQRLGTQDPTLQCHAEAIASIQLNTPQTKERNEEAVASCRLL